MSATTRHLAAAAVPVRQPQPYVALGHATCRNRGCVLGLGHKGGCLPAPRRIQRDAR
jgi:hypothetical protein